MEHEHGFYTLARWRVREGEDEAFVEAWRAVGEAFAALDGGTPGTGTLIRSLDDPRAYVSFGPWASLDDIQAMRGDPAAQAAMKRIVDLCDEAEPGAYEVVEVVVGAPTRDAA